MNLLKLVDPNAVLCEAWKVAFDGLPGVSISHCGFENLDGFDCIVSPANSFGLMDGGVDAAIARFFGSQLVERVQARIIQRFSGEQPVGTSMLVPTESELHPWIAHTPTMRTPRSIAGTDAVYRAMRAMLRETDWLRVVACPGLGTLTGKVSPRSAAAQMALAYRTMRNVPKQLDWDYARKTQAMLDEAVRL